MGFKIFDKIRAGANKVFEKVRTQAPKMLEKVSQGLSQAGNIAKHVEGVAQAIVNDPIIQSNAGNNKYFKTAQTALNSNLGSKLLNKSSDLTNIKNYGGDSKDITNNILERAKSIGRDVQDGTGQKMHFV